MTETNNPIELAYLALAVFAEDGTLDMKELDSLLSHAHHEGTMIDQEKRILANVFDRISEADVAPDVWDRIQTIRRRGGI